MSKGPFWAGGIRQTVYRGIRRVDQHFKLTMVASCKERRDEPRRRGDGAARALQTCALLAETTRCTCNSAANCTRKPREHCFGCRDEALFNSLLVLDTMEGPCEAHSFAYSSRKTGIGILVLLQEAYFRGPSIVSRTRTIPCRRSLDGATMTQHINCMLQKKREDNVLTQSHLHLICKIIGKAQYGFLCGIIEILEAFRAGEHVQQRGQLVDSAAGRRCKW
jgi:hypothetical protein